jgi:crossover junction endodeoxyribonuclease RusA
MASLRIITGWPSSNLSPNGRPNRWQKAKSLRQAKNEGFIATLANKPVGFQFGPGPLKVTIFAQPPTKREPDDDNIVASAKGFRDGIAAALGVDDNRFENQPVEWLEPKKPGRLFFVIEGDAHG